MITNHIRRQSALRPSPKNLPQQLQSVVEYRKSGLSLNHIVGCPLDCGYCVRHLFDNFDMKRPHLIMNDEMAVEELVHNPWFRQHTTPIQLFNKATDPFLPNVKDHLHRTLELIDDRRLTNPVLVITRWRIDDSDVRRLEELRYLRLTILVTWSGIDDERIEPVNGQIAVESLRNLKRAAVRTKRILYWRPVVAGLNDDERCISRARQLANLADATVFTGCSIGKRFVHIFDRLVFPICIKLSNGERFCLRKSRNGLFLDSATRHFSVRHHAELHMHTSSQITMAILALKEFVIFVHETRWEFAGPRIARRDSTSFWILRPSRELKLAMWKSGTGEF